MQHNVRFLAGWIALTVLGGCSPSEAPNAATDPLPHEHRFELTLNDRKIHVQLAVTPAESARGLMQREHLDPDEGMLFVFQSPQRASFWMKNTPLPLDIGYFSSDGVLLEVHRMFPYDETSVVSSGHDVHLALEMNQGWFSQHRIRPGARLDMEELTAAIRQRGFDPGSFRL